MLAGRGLGDRRILIEFRKDHIDIRRSKNQRAPAGFTVLPVKLIRGHVPTVEVTVGRVRAKAIIDTGAQQTTGNLALRDALLKQRRLEEKEASIIGVTGDVQEGPTSGVPPIMLARQFPVLEDVQIDERDLHVTNGHGVEHDRRHAAGRALLDVARDADDRGLLLL